MQNSLLIAKREFLAYFSTPLAYVFMVAFLAAAGAMPFYFGGFFARRQADGEMPAQPRNARLNVLASP